MSRAKNNLVTLNEVCVSRQLETKWLLSPSLRTGHQRIERLVRNGQRIVNLQPTTLSRLALTIAGPELVQAELTAVGQGVAAAVVDAEWDKLPDDGYLGKLERSAGVTSSVSDAMLSLRRVGLTSDDLAGGNFENSAKAADLRRLLAAYEDYLRTQSLVDDADLLRMAIGCVTKDGLPHDWLILVPESLQAVGLERQLLDAIPESAIIPIRDEPEQADGNSDTADLAFFRAIGPANEIREVFRRCICGAISLDDVELLHSDSATYVPLVHALSHRHSDSDAKPVPVTFADGVPAIMSRPGRALSGWLRWIRDGFPQRLLVELLEAGVIQTAKNDRCSPAFLVRLLRPLSIGLGAENYQHQLDAAIHGATAELDRRRNEADDTDDNTSSSAQLWERRLAGYQSLKKLVTRLLDLSQDVTSESPSECLPAAERFLSEMAFVGGELDGKASEALTTAMRDRRTWLQTLAASMDCTSWLLALADQTQVMSSGPKPGHLHVASIGSGGQSARSQTFIVGLDDQRFPGAFLQDPILLDHERQQLHPELPNSQFRLNQKLSDFEATLKRLQGHVTFSWSCLDPLDDRELYPAAALRAIFSAATGDGSPDAFEAAIGTPVSFAPDVENKSLDESERWLWRLNENDALGGNQTSLVEERYQHLRRGAEAAGRRFSEFGAFSGHVPGAGEALKPFNEDGLVLSASTLELAGRCPLAFFFRKALRVEPLDDLELDLDRWLDAAQFGSLMHDVFRQFMEELAADNQTPDFDRDHKKLAAILQDSVQQWKQDVPPPNENAFRADVWKLVRTAGIFLQKEEEFCRTSTPRFFEAAIGLESVGSGTPLDSPDPAIIELSSGRIRARGQVDRVDETGTGGFSIWDYKIGSGYGYEQSDPFRQGRRVQSVLYLRMVEETLRQHAQLTGRVEQFGYFFPSIRAQGLRLNWPAGTLVPGNDILNSLCSTISAGEFPATDTKDDCRYCDYSGICRDVVSVTQASSAQLDAMPTDGAGVPLTYFRELRRG